MNNEIYYCFVFQNYARSYVGGQPLVETMPYMRHEYGMPVEIPVIHEGSHASPESERKSGGAKKPRIPEDETIGPDTTIRQEIRTKKQPSPKPHQKKPSSKPYGTRHVPVNDMESSENMYDDEFPFFCPEASSEMYEDEFPFGNGFPFLTSSRRLPCTNVPASKTTSQKAAAKSAPKVVNKPAEKSTPRKSTATTEPQTADEHQHNKKVRQVPIVMENAQHAFSQPQPKLPIKKPLTAMEQLENIQKEMEVIENGVEHFSGEKKDKEYIVLDETMTSLLLKLDMIESNGVEEIRNKRRQLVRHIQECVQKLECKVGIVSPAEEANTDEAEMMEAGDAETNSKEETDEELKDEVMDSQGTAEEQTQAPDLDVEKAPLTEGSSHHDRDLVKSPRLEGEVQTKVDETASSLQEMVVDNTDIESNCTTQNEVNPEVENRTFEQTTASGDTIRTTDSKAITDTKQVEETIETNLDTMVSHCSENCDVGNEKHLSSELDSVKQDSDK